MVAPARDMGHAYLEGSKRTHVFHAVHADRQWQPLDNQNQDSACDERPRDSYRIEQIGGYVFVQQETQYGGRKKRNEQIQHKKPFMPDSYASDQAADAHTVIPDYSEDGAELNDDFESFTVAITKLEQIAHDNQVSSGRYR
jgi:hypothetical protein